MADQLNVIYGAGCQGRVCFDTARVLGIPIHSFIDDQPDTGTVMHTPVVSLEQFTAQKADHFNFVLAVGNNVVRKKLYHLLTDMGGSHISLIHPFHSISSDATFKQGIVSMAGAIVNTGAVIGNGAVLNTSCSVDHDCIIEDFVNLCPGVRLAGNVHVGEGSFLGTGAIVIPNTKIGRGCTIGAGAVVTRDIPDHATAYGVPAKVKNVIKRYE